MESEGASWVGRFVEALGVVVATLVRILTVVASELLGVVMEYGGLIALFLVFYGSYRLLRTGMNIPGRNYREVGTYRRLETPASRLMKFTVPGALAFLLGIGLLLVTGNGAALGIVLRVLIIAGGIALAFQGSRMYSVRAVAETPTEAESGSGVHSLLTSPSFRASAVVAGGLIVALLALSSLNGRVRDLGEDYQVRAGERTTNVDEQLGEVVDRVRQALRGSTQDADESDIVREAVTSVFR